MNNKSPFQPGAFIAAYLRDSGNEDQELSVEQQEIAIRAWAIENDLILNKIFIDAAAPGSSVIGRTSFLEMIQHFRSSDCQEDGIVIWKYNRFARDIDDAQFYKADLRRRGFIIYSLNDTLPDSLDGRFFESAIDWMNSRFLEDLRVDVKRGLNYILTQHGAIGGTPPRGFKREKINIGAHRDGSPRIVSRWVLDEPEIVERCKLAWKMRSQGASYKTIHETTHLYSSINSYSTFFKNRLYLGELVFGDVVIPEYVDAIIDQNTWDQVQKINSRNINNNNLKGTHNANHPRRIQSHFLLSGLAYCAICGAPLNGEVIKFKQKPDHRYEYYSCSGAQRKSGCSARKIPKGTLEQAVVETLSDFLLEPRNRRERHNQYEGEIKNQANLVLFKQRELKKQLQTIQRKIQNITEIVADEGQAARSLLGKLTELELQESRLRTELDQYTSRQSIDQSNYNDDFIQSMASRTRDILNTEDQSVIKKILNGLIHKIIVERDGQVIRGMVEYYFPPIEEGPDTQAPTPTEK